MLKCVPSNVCSLCQEPLGSIKVQDEEHAFCCHGCKTVYTILEEKKELDQGHHHPIFQQALDSGLISNPSLIDQFKVFIFVNIY